MIASPSPTIETNGNQISVWILDILWYSVYLCLAFLADCLSWPIVKSAEKKRTRVTRGVCVCVSVRVF